MSERSKQPSAPAGLDHRDGAGFAAGEASFRALADSAPAPVWMTDQSGMVFVNQALVAFSGLTREALLGIGWTGLIHPDDLPEVMAGRAAAWARASLYEFVARMRRHDGEWRWLNASMKPRLAESGAPAGFVGMALDITDTKQAEAALRESEQRLLVALAAGRLGDWVWDAASDMVTFSDQAAALFGIPAGPVMTWAKMQALIEPGDAARAAVAVEAAVAAREDYDVEYRLLRPDGGFVWINAVGRPIYDDDGRPKGMIGVVRDISARKAAAEVLEEEKRSLETLNRIGASIAPELDLQRVVQMVTDAGVELSGAQFGAFFYNVENEAGESYMLYTISGVDPAEFAKFPMPRNTAVFAPTFEGAGVVRSDDITRDPRYGKNAPYKGMPDGHLPVAQLSCRAGDVAARAR